MPVLTSSNFLQNVATYQPGVMAYLLNSHCFISTANKKYNNFQNSVGQLGQTVTFQKPYRFIASSGLVAQTQPITQYTESLTVDKSVNVTASYTAQEQLFNLEDFFTLIGRGAAQELGDAIEIDIAKIILSNTYRFYGNGVSPISSFGQLSEMNAMFSDYGAANFSKKAYLNMLSVPAIVNSGLGQFTPERNNEMAQSWMVGSSEDVTYYKTNLLPKHTAGTVGESNKSNSPQTLTVVSTNDPSGANITQITCSGATANDPLAIAQYDLASFNDDVSGKPNLRYLTWIGHHESGNKVQFQITQAAAANGSGNVVLNIFPALRSTESADRNILYNITAGMKISVVPSHKRGLLNSGDSLYLAMPSLPDQRPYDCVRMIDDESGAGFRFTMGSRLGENLSLMEYDAIWGKTLIPENSMAIIFPI